MDRHLRIAERAYAQDPTTETLQRYNSALVMSGQEAFLPLEHLQMLYEDITNLLDGVFENNSGMGGADTFRVVNGHYPQSKTRVYQGLGFRVTAYNIFGLGHNDVRHLNAHLTITKKGRYRYENESHELNIFTDDVIYGSWYCDPQRSLLPNNQKMHSLHQFTLPLHQPWVYSAKDILDFCLQHWDEVQGFGIEAQRNPDVNIRSLERQVLANSGDAQAWQALVQAHLRIGEPLVVTFFSGKGGPEYLRRWVSQEIYEVNALGRYKYLHLLPLNQSSGTIPRWSHAGSLFAAEGLHLGRMASEEEKANRELIEYQQRLEDDQLDAFEGSMW